MEWKFGLCNHEKNKQRVERLTKRNENFAPEISKFEVRWEKNW